jgi:EmrB/QacA subfamily drug resistance transporter
MTYQTTNQITGNRRGIALAAVMVTMFFSSLDQTIVGTAIPTIIAELKGIDLMAWLFTAYMITSAVMVPIYGKLSDIYGRKPFYVFGLALFIVGSALAGQAHSMGFLIASRALQGLGGGAMLSMPRATIGDIFNPKERGKWMGLIMSVFGLASIVGPFVGGWLTDTVGWRWCFYINLPIGIAALAAVAWALPNVRTDTRHHIDWKGGILLVLGLIPILLAFSWAGTRFAWGSWQIVSMLAAGALLVAVFFLVERGAEEPVLTPRLFRNPIFSVTVAIGFLLGISMFGGLMFLPLFIQGVLGMSARNSGAVMTPMMLSFVAGSVAGGFLVTRTGRYKVQAIVGTLVMVTAMILLSRMTVSTSWYQVIGIMLVMGIGLGTTMPLINVAIQNAFPYREMGVVNGTQQFVQSLGGVVVAPIFGTILNDTFNSRMRAGLPSTFSAATARLPKAFQDLLANPQALVTSKAQEALKERFEAFGQAGADLYRQFSDTVRHSLTAGVTRLFTIGIVFALLALVMAFLLEEIPLKKDEFFKADASAGGNASGTAGNGAQEAPASAARPAIAGPDREPAGAEG